MTLPRDLGDRLKKAGLTVIEFDGHETRGRPGSFGPAGVLNHHTGASAKTWDRVKRVAYARWMFLEGRSDLPAPLCQIALGPDGEVYLGALGRANHAGTAASSGSMASGDGNALYVGIEWMLSGTETIPAKMYEAGALLNAVLLETLRSSVQAVSCHYNTSVTGKWDIGDPNGISFRGAKVLDVPKFRRAVQAKLDARKGPVKPAKIKVTLQHSSLQYSDTPRQMSHDVNLIFSRGADVVSGTEVGGQPLFGMVKAMAAEKGYRVKIYRSNFVAVRRSIIVPGSWNAGHVMVARAAATWGPGHDSAFPWVEWKDKRHNRVTSVACGHYPIGFKKGKNHEIIRDYAGKVGAWARKAGAGKDIAFYTGDQNVDDAKHDTFFGSPLTSAWDEVGRHPNTGHGNIDVIASYDHDAAVRVRPGSVRALNDKKLMLHSDHFLVEAAYDVDVLEAAK